MDSRRSSRFQYHIDSLYRDCPFGTPDNTKCLGVLQENVLRTWKAVAETAERLQKSNPRGNGRFIPDEDFLEEELSCKELYPWL